MMFHTANIVFNVGCCFKRESMIKNKLPSLFVVLYCITMFPQNSAAQCCAGGSGCSIAGGASTGVLLERQVELSSSFQFINTDKFYKKDKVAPDSVRTFDSFQST